MSHLDEGTIHAWLDGALLEDEAARVDAHAKECAECAALVAEARGFIAGASRIVSSLDVVRGDVIPTAAPSVIKATQPSLWRQLRFTPARAAIAATVLIGVASMFTLRGQREMATAQADRAVGAPSAPAPSAPAPAPSAGAPVPTQVARADSVAPAESRAVAKRVPKTEAVAKASDVMVAGGVASIGTSSPASPVAPVVAAAGASPMADNMARRAFTSSAVMATPLTDGCYRLSVEGGALPNGVPEQFQLQRDPVSGRNVVKTGAIAGDSVLNGAGWRSVTDGGVVVQLTGAVELSFNVGRSTASIVSGARTIDATIARLACAR